MGSTSLGGASGSGDSLNGLKFGQKIYFEDVGGGGSAPAAIPAPPTPAPASAGSSSNTDVVVASPGKKGRGAAQGGRPPRCQVEGCHVDLTGTKAYYCRHKVCGMHSKTPEVIVAGLKQRFCQQCSRFHQLSEFDHGKRSCRRRLAGHNERRRKPPPGSLIPPRYARIGSRYCSVGICFIITFVFLRCLHFIPEHTSKVGNFMDFSYSRMHGRDAWPSFHISEHTSSNQVTSTGKYLPNLFRGAYDIPSTNVVGHTAQTYLQETSVGDIFPGTEVSAGEAFSSVSGTVCALSLLSTQQWDPRNRSSSINNLMDDNRAHPAQSAAHAPVPNQFISNEWGFKHHTGGGSSHNLSLQQIHDSSDPQYSAAGGLSQHGSRQFMEQGQSGGNESSSHQMNWSL